VIDNPSSRMGRGLLVVRPSPTVMSPTILPAPPAGGDLLHLDETPTFKSGGRRQLKRVAQQHGQSYVAAVQKR